MTREQMLKQAIEKVHENLGQAYWLTDMDRIKDRIFDESYKSIIFSHRFAKAFWGEEIKERYKIDNIAISYEEYIWQLMLMVRYSDPIKYLEKFLINK